VFSNVRISTRLFVSFGVVLCIATASAVLSIARLSQVAAASTEISQHWMRSVDHLSAVNTAASDMRLAQIGAVIADDAEEAQEMKRQLENATRVFESEKADYLAIAADTAGNSGWKKFDAQWREYTDYVAKALALAATNTSQAENDLQGTGRKLFDAAGDTLQVLVDEHTAAGDAAATQATSLYASARLMILLTLVALVAIGVLTAVLTARAISQPLEKTADIFKRIAAGHLDNEIEVTRHDEIGALLLGLRDMQGKLKSQIDSERAAAAASERAKQALDAVTANVLVIDADLNIVYTNPAVDTLLKNAEADIRKDLPSFSAARVSGSSIDIFYKSGTATPSATVA
jgi:nitrogen fixation/metabolism regulation signal transduction histidine kinase